MTNTSLIGIEIGVTDAETAIIDGTGNLVASVCGESNLDYPIPGRAGQDPNEVYGSVIHRHALWDPGTNFFTQFFKILLLTCRVVFLIISCNNRITTNHLLY